MGPETETEKKMIFTKRTLINGMLLLYYFSALGEGELLALRGLFDELLLFALVPVPHNPEIWRYIEEIPDLVASTALLDFPFKSYWASSFSNVAVVVVAADT